MGDQPLQGRSTAQGVRVYKDEIPTQWHAAVFEAEKAALRKVGGGKAFRDECNAKAGPCSGKSQANMMNR